MSSEFSYAGLFGSGGKSQIYDYSVPVWLHFMYFDRYKVDVVDRFFSTQAMPGIYTLGLFAG